MKVIINKLILPTSAFVLVYCSIACRKFVEVPPPTNIITEDAVYNSDQTAISVLTGLYHAMNTTPIQGTESIAVYLGLASDEYTLTGVNTNPTHIAYYRNELNQSNSPSVWGGEHWVPLYNSVFKCNAAIEGLSKSSSLTPIVKQRLLGEAKFLRAFFYFYLVNEFGDVPLALVSNPSINSALPRAGKSKVYDQIKADLIEAKELLSNEFLMPDLVSSTSERVRPTKWAATALLSRVYLFTEEFAKAEIEASSVISNNTLFSLLPLNNVFLKNSGETIWQLQPTSINLNTIEGRTLVIPPTGPNGNNNPVYLRKSWLNNFEAGDQRRVFGNWIDTTIYRISTSPIVWDTIAYPYKYKIYSSSGVNSTGGLTEYFMVLRLGEQYLIRAEARAKQSNLSGAIYDLDKIRGRAGLPLIAVTNPGIIQSVLLDTILHERQVELFSEWGHRWFDLKRTGNIDPVMSVVAPQKAPGTTWNSYQQLFPIPLVELQRAPHLTQNPGY